MISIEEAKKIICKLAKQLYVPPELITTRLLDDNDKLDLREGNLSIYCLRAHIEVWKQYGMQDYVTKVNRN